MKKYLHVICYSIINELSPKKIKKKPLIIPKSEDDKPPQVILKFRDDLGEHLKQGKVNWRQRKNLIS